MAEIYVTPAIGHTSFEYFFMSLSAQSWQYRDRRKPEAVTMPYSNRMTSRVLYSAKYHRQLFKQFQALYMHSSDDKHLTLPRFELIISEFRAAAFLTLY